MSGPIVESTHVDHCRKRAKCTLCGETGQCKVFRLAGAVSEKLALCLLCCLTVRSVLHRDLEDSGVELVSFEPGKNGATS